MQTTREPSVKELASIKEGLGDSMGITSASGPFLSFMERLFRNEAIGRARAAAKLKSRHGSRNACVCGRMNHSATLKCKCGRQLRARGGRRYLVDQ